MYTENYEQEIDLKDLLFYLLYQWRVLLLAAVLGMAALAGVKVVKSGQSSVKEEVQQDYDTLMEEYEAEKLAAEKAIENLQASMEEQNRYIAEAPLMQINPYNEVCTTADILVEARGESADNRLTNLLQLYKNTLLSGDYISEIARAAGTETRYIKDLISIEENNSSVSSGQEIIVLEDAGARSTMGRMRITVIGNEESLTEMIMEYVLSEAEEIGKTLESEIGEHSLKVLAQSTGDRVDLDILTKQQRVRNSVTDLQKSLTAFEDSLDKIKKPENVLASGVSSKGVLKYAILGFLAGGFVATCAYCAVFILNDKVTSEKEICTRFGIKSLGEFSREPKKKKRVLGFIDSWLHRLAGDVKNCPDEIVYEMIAANIENYGSGKHTLFITGMASPETLKRICDRLSRDLTGYEIKCQGDMVANASARRMLAECDGAVLVEEQGVSRYSQIQQELEIASNVGVEVVGVVVA